LQPRAEPELTIRGAFPAFDYQQADARIIGLDWTGDLELYKNLHLESKISLINGWNRELHDFLIYMPPFRFDQGLKLNFSGQKHPDHPSFVRLGVLAVMRQQQAPATDYATPPPGYVRVDAEFFHTFEWGKQHLELGISVFNLFNTSYREYLNRFRYFTAEPGRNLGFRLKVPFNFTPK
jgi:iron complex outermembrane receptor protein